MSAPPCPRASRVLGVGLLVALLGATNLGCVILRRPVVLPPREQPYVAVLSGQLDEPLTMVARHSWIVANPGKGHELARYELGFGGGSRRPTSRLLVYLDEHSTALHGVLKGDREKIGKIMACLDVETPRYDLEHPRYLGVPGPNSNTYVDQMMRRCGIPFELPATAIGKDYRDVIGASVTTGGTGVQLETWLAGIKVGVTEGIELHILGFSIGVDFWPPALIVPVDPGRIGFDDR